MDIEISGLNNLRRIWNSLVQGKVERIMQTALKNAGAQMVQEAYKDIEQEDLAGWLIRMAAQPGRSAMSVLFVGRIPTPDDLRPRAGTFRVIWWN